MTGLVRGGGKGRAALAALLGLSALAIQLAALLLLVYGTPFADRINLISLTVGAVWCPHSVTVGWNLGRGWTLVRNVVLCPPGRLPSAWVQLWWRRGGRTVLCVDLGRERC